MNASSSSEAPDGGGDIIAFQPVWRWIAHTNKNTQGVTIVSGLSLSLEQEILVGDAPQAIAWHDKALVLAVSVGKGVIFYTRDSIGDGDDKLKQGQTVLKKHKKIDVKVPVTSIRFGKKHVIFGNRDGFMLGHAIAFDNNDWRTSSLIDVDTDVFLNFSLNRQAPVTFMDFCPAQRLFACNQESGKSIRVWAVTAKSSEYQAMQKARSIPPPSTRGGQSVVGEK